MHGLPIDSRLLDGGVSSAANEEIAFVRSALTSGEPSFVALHVTGAGGVGKTTLLQEFARVAHEAGRRVVRIDGRNIEASPLGFLVALSHALGADRCDLTAVLERWPAGGVLLVDTYELLTPLDEWLRDTLLPQLPARSLVVIAGRHEPGTAWRTHVDWAALTRIHPLGNLGPDESRTYLTRCGVPGAASRGGAGVHARASAGAVAHGRCADARRPVGVIAPRRRARDRAPAHRRSSCRTCRAASIAWRCTPA